MIASYHGHIEIVRLLLSNQNSQNINMQNKVNKYIIWIIMSHKIHNHNIYNMIYKYMY
jgi:ankyrin repeat protein